MPLPEVTAAAWGAMVEVSPQQRSACGCRAAALGVSRQTVISIEGGRYLPSLPLPLPPSLPLAFAIARFFDMTVDKMFDPADEEEGA
jgi:putative transcriptional regulator